MKNTYKILPNISKLCVFAAFIVLLFTNCSLVSQSITWQRTYNLFPFNQDDIAYAVCKTTDDNFIVAGTGGLNSIWVIKISPFGDTIWTATPSSGVAYAVVATNDGGCILTGLGDSSKAFTIRLSQNGNTVWNKSYGGTDVRLYSIIKSSDGGYVSCGNDWRTNIDGLIIKIDSLGNLIWKKYFLAGFDKTLFSICEVNGTNLIVTGVDEISNSNAQPGKTLVMKLNNFGDSIWVNRYSINSTSCLGKYITSKNNRYIIGGRTADTLIPGQEWPFILKLDTNGNLIFRKDFTSSNYEYYLSFAVLQNSYAFSTSIIFGNNHISGKIYITDTNGTVIRQKVINDTGQVELNAIFPLINGDIIFTGYRGDYGITQNDFLVIRTDSLLYAPPISIINNSTILPSDFVLYPNYPNPFNPITRIKFDILKKCSVKLDIFDILGKKLETLLDKDLYPGTYNIEWNAGINSNISSGIYFLRMSISTGSTYTEKLILVK